MDVRRVVAVADTRAGAALNDPADTEQADAAAPADTAAPADSPAPRPVADPAAHEAAILAEAALSVASAPRATQTDPASTADQPAAGAEASEPPVKGSPPTEPPDKSSPPTDPAVPPPAVPPARRSSPLWARLMVIVGALLMVASGVLVGGEKLLANRYDNRIKRDNLVADGARVDTGADAPRPTRIVGPLNFLLLGSDARPGEPDLGQRADTIIVAHVSVTLDRVYLLSIPRDLRVEIPAYGPTGFKGSHEKINAAYFYGGGGTGGVRLLTMTVSNLLGIRFDGAALIDFDGFHSVVKALGGVDMCIDHRVVSEHIGFDRNGNFLSPRDGGTPVVYEPGCRELNDWQALDYVRQRYSLPDGDYGRQRHQQQFLRAMLARARDKGVVTNPLKLDQVLRAVAGTLTIDTGNVPLDVLMFGLRGIGPSDITGVTVPSEPQWIGNTSYVVAFDEATALYKALVNDDLETWVAANPRWVNRL